MPDVAPFEAIRYDPAVVDPAAVTSPPYDVISPAERIELEQASPYNVVRLILGPSEAGDDRYLRSRALMDDWLDARVLVRDAVPTITVYEERFSVGGAERRQTGVLAAVEISEEILPHERTMAPIVEDRLAVIRATRANLSPVACLYWSDEPAFDRPSSDAEWDFTTPDGLGHRAWRVEDAAAVERVQKVIGAARVVIADGHHRYRTAEAYRDEMRLASGPGPWDRMLLYLVDAERDAPALLPIHRLVRGVALEAALGSLRDAFAIEPGPADAAALAALIAERRPEGRCYGLFDGSAGFIATLNDEDAARRATEGEHCEAWRDLDVAVLGELVFSRLLGSPDVTYVHSPEEAAAAVAAGEASFAVLLAATPIDAVRAVAEARDSMPPKSTFFVPKARTGIAIRPLDRP